MIITPYDDARACLAAVRDYLEENEAEHSLLLGFLSRPGVPALYMARIHDGDETRGVAYLSDLNLVVSRGAGAHAEALLAALGDRPVPGIVGPRDDVQALAAALGKSPSTVIEQMLYQLREVIPVTGVPGRMRVMEDRDVDLVADWLRGFYADALPHETPTPEAARANAMLRPALGYTHLWEVEGTPVAMAALARPTRHGVTVNAVYTPPAHRKRGYASALVAGLSAEGLRRGYDFCVLYTDLANPTSNAIYQAVGYVPVDRSQNVRFDA